MARSKNNSGGDHFECESQIHIWNPRSKQYIERRKSQCKSAKVTSNEQKGTSKK